MINMTNKITKAKVLKSRIQVMVQDKSKPVKQDEFGREVIPIKWNEAAIISLGSINNPNRDIIQIKIQTGSWEDA